VLSAAIDISPLARQWNLTSEQEQLINRREGEHCGFCGCNARVRLLARGLLDEVTARHGRRYRSVAALARKDRALRIAEINHLASLHPLLAPHPGLAYSEFGSKDPAVRHEDLTTLSYPDASFDFVLTSDTLEHVPDFDQAMRETLRILRPGGAHLFTIPILWDRPTRERARLVDGKVENLLEPSYHGDPAQALPDWLVFYEFGGDVVPRIEAAGFSVEVVRDPGNDLNTLIRAVRPS